MFNPRAQLEEYACRVFHSIMLPGSRSRYFRNSGAWGPPFPRRRFSTFGSLYAWCAEGSIVKFRVGKRLGWVEGLRLERWGRFIRSTGIRLFLRSIHQLEAGHKKFPLPTVGDCAQKARRGLDPIEHFREAPYGALIREPPKKNRSNHQGRVDARGVSRPDPVKGR